MILRNQIIGAFSLLICFSLNLKSQNRDVKDFQDRPVRSSSLMPADGIEVTSSTPDNSVQLDARAVKHYSKEEILRMSAIQKKKVNLIYTKSFEITGSNTECNTRIQETFDIHEYLNKRQYDSRVKFPANIDGCKVVVELLSDLELRSLTK